MLRPVRCIITCNGQTDHGAVGKRQLPLHESLSESTSPHNHSSVPILHCSRKNFAGRSRSFVNKHHQIAFLEIAFVGGIDTISGLIFTFGIDDKFAIFEKLVGDIGGSLQNTPSRCLSDRESDFSSLPRAVHFRLFETHRQMWRQSGSNEYSPCYCQPYTKRQCCKWEFCRE